MFVFFVFFLEYDNSGFSCGALFSSPLVLISYLSGKPLLRYYLLNYNKKPFLHIHSWRKSSTEIIGKKMTKPTFISHTKAPNESPFNIHLLYSRYFLLFVIFRKRIVQIKVYIIRLLTEHTNIYSNDTPFKTSRVVAPIGV